MTDRRSERLISTPWFSTSTLWFSAQFGTLLVAGPVFATLVAGLGAAARSARQRLVPRLKSAGAAMAATLASGLLFAWLKALPNEFEWVWQAFVLTATVAAYCAVRGGLIFASRVLASQRVDRAWVDSMLRDARTRVISASAVALIVQVIGHQQWGLLCCVLLPVYCV